ncbi:MAG TPA: hypothetical protein VMZ51_02020 [Acidimicrobiales bacterium]|nr:hypothetical protein [Acidimicrobiales bacterium]
MQTDANTAGPRTSGGTLAPGEKSVLDRAIAVVLASPSIRDEAVCRGRTLLASPQWCRADEVAAELIRCYAGRLVP